MSWGKTAFLGLLIAVGLTAYAIGAGGSSKNLVLCAGKKSGALSLATHKGKCAKGEKKLTIAKQGPVGPQGAVGPAGSAANVVPEAIHFVVSPGSPACQSQPGTFCKPTGLSGEFENFVDVAGGDAERVGYYKDPSGRVHLSGTTGWFSSGGSPGGFEPEGPFYLPAGYRPAHTLYFLVPSTNGSSQELSEITGIQVRSNGLVYASDSFNNAFSLDGVSFRP